VPDFKFKARPAPSKMLNDTVVLNKPRSQAKTTKAIAPHFASDDRLRAREQKRTNAVPVSSIFVCEFFFSSADIHYT